MSRTIYKYPLTDRPHDGIHIIAPAAFTPLTVQMQGYYPCLWAEVNTDAPTVSHALTVVGTGRRVDRDATYVGTWQDEGFVWHLYYEGIQ